MKTSLFGRTTELLTLAAKVGARGVFSGSAKTKIDQARMIAESLGDLKGAAMKAGQMLSLEMADYFPPEAVEYLAKLQNQSSAVPYTVIENMLKTELGDKRLDFEKFGRTAIASASIGQVHAAELNGQRVAVKIQYPGVRESIGTDLNVLKKLTSSMCLLTGRSMDWTEVFNELNATLSDEANYLREGQFLSEYGARLRSDEELRDRIIVPEWIRSHSSERVLTMSFADGILMRDWLESSPNPEVVERLAHLILTLYIKEFYDWGMVQTDPNFANFLVKGDQLVLLDFGSTRVYTKEFKDSYIHYLRAIESRDRKRVIEAAEEFDLLSPLESAESKELFYNFMLHSVLPFMWRDGEFDFASQEYVNKSHEMGREFVMSLRYTPPPSRILFLHRRLGGMFALLKKMKVKIDVRPYWQKIVGG